MFNLPSLISEVKGWVQKPVWWCLSRLEASCALLCFALWPGRKRMGERAVAGPALASHLRLSQLLLRLELLSGRLDIGDIQERKAEAVQAQVPRLSKSIGLETWFINVAGPSGSLSCMRFQYWAPVWGLCSRGAWGRAKGSFGNYLADLMAVAHQMGASRKPTPGHKLFCLVVCIDHINLVRAKIHSLCATGRQLWWRCISLQGAANFGFSATLQLDFKGGRGKKKKK